MENFADWLFRARMRKGKFTSQLAITGRYQSSKRCRQAIVDALGVTNSPLNKQPTQKSRLL